MKKRFSILTLVAILIFIFVFSVPSMAQQQVVAEANGFTNVPFSNGYHGYCIDRDLHGAYVDDVFYASDTSVAKSNVDNNDISQYLKIFFTQYFEDLFVSDGNGSYVSNDNLTGTIIPSVVYHFSDGQYVWGTNPGDRKYYTENIKAYTGPAIPDEGYTILLDNGDYVTFYFMCLEPEKTDQQTFFSYKIEVSQEAPTTETTTESTTVETTTETTTESTTVETTTETTTEEDDDGSGGEGVTGSGGRPNPGETTTEENDNGSGGEGVTGSGGRPNPGESTTSQGGATNGGADDEGTTTVEAQGSGSVKNPNTDRVSYTRALTIVLIVSGFGIVLFSNRKKLSYN